MKLFRKIFLQVFIGCLLLSQIPFFYFLYESQRQSVASAQKYEEEYFQRCGANFESEITKTSKMDAEKEILNLTAVNVFRNIFGNKAVLYSSGQELYNNTPYEFDLEKIRHWSARVSKTRSAGYDEKTEPQIVNGKKLLIFYEQRKITTDSSYQIIYYKDVTDIFERTKQLFLKGLLFTLVLLILVGLVLYLGIYRTIRPLMELKQASSLIAGGAYESRVPVRGKDEIGELACSFNQMAQKVEEHVEKLSHTNEVQRQLIGSLAHELKTPMTAIIGYADTLLTVRLSEKWRVQSLNYIESECRRLSRLSAKMMELTGLYENVDSISMKETKVAELLGRLEDLTSHRLEEKMIHLETFCHPDDLTMQIDEDLMMSLLMNLVDNAFKASEENSTITVSAAEHSITVEDTGKGIPLSEVAMVTEAFYMVNKSRSRSAGSIGLGLTFCQQIAALHGAELVIDSEEGKGTKVSVVWE
jgi:signal transduction histidine kinase